MFSILCLSGRSEVVPATNNNYCLLNREPRSDPTHRAVMNRIGRQESSNRDPKHLSPWGVDLVALCEILEELARRRDHFTHVCIQRRFWAIG